MLRKLLSLCAAFLFVMAQARDYYVVTGENVNLRQAPVNGKVVGKLNTSNSFLADEAENGWIYVDVPGEAKGYISSKYVKKTGLKTFSKSMLGNYFGLLSDSEWSYSFAVLKEKDGYIVLDITDYSQPDEFGLRRQMTHIFVGLPTSDGVTFTHYLYAYDPDAPLKPQIHNEDRMDTPYSFVVTEDNNLRSFDRVLEKQ